ncbi:MAG: hypothetical protein HY315_02465 [Acidobacteria bacterium]|nr:hypothetical protein [Acidobacteriota bacterium]
MPSVTIEVRSYACRIFSTRTEQDPGAAEVAVQVYDRDGRQVGSLEFNGVSGPLPQAQDVGGIYHLYYRRTALPDVVDMLRNERPVYLVYQPEGVNNSCIQTIGEPAGEGEGLRGVVSR